MRIVSMWRCGRILRLRGGKGVGLGRRIIGLGWSEVEGSYVVGGNFWCE